jgi:fructose-1,6-bisphosphatase/sedoheptulose 1,7-bisphosphatase-like protein
MPQAIESVRWAVLELTRVTEQCAVLSSFISGTGIKRTLLEKTARLTACKAFLQCLDHSLCPPARLVCIDPPWQGYHVAGNEPWKVPVKPAAAAKRFWSRYGDDHQFGRLKLFLSDAPARSAVFEELDLIISPIDGVKSLLLGHQGSSLSIVAGGPRGTFSDPMPWAQNSPLTRYFILAVRDEGLVRVCERVLGQVVNSTFSATAAPIANVQELQKLFGEQLQRWKGADDVPRVAAINAESPFGVAELFGSRYPVRMFHGSPIGAALAVFLGTEGFDLLTGVVRETTAYLLAAAAFALGRTLFAVRLSADEQKEAILCPRRALVLREGAFVKGEDVFVVATAITGHPVLSGVQIAGGVAITHSLVVNGKSKSVRFLKHERQLNDDVFCSLAQPLKLKPTSQVIREFTQGVLTHSVSSHVPTEGAAAGDE